MDDGADRLLAGLNARETKGVKQPMRVLKWMTVFASLALFSLAVQAQGQSGRVDINGDAAVEIADFFEEDRSELYYFVIDKRSRARTQLFFPDLPDAAFKSGAKVRIRGKSRGKGKGINVETIEVIEAAPEPFSATAPDGGPIAEAPVASTQTRKVLTLVVNFLDADVDTGTANAVTPQIITDRMFNETKNVQHFYNLASLGTLTIPTDPNGIGKKPVFGPYTINYNYLTTNGGTCIAGTWADAALDMWEADTVGNPARETRSDYDNWSIIVPNYWDYTDRACTWGGYAGVGCTQCWAFSADPASILHGVVIHELGHNFGFGHARFDTNNDGSSDCEYCDSSDMMGGSRNWMKFNAAHFSYQGWWDPVSYEIDTVTPSSTSQEFHLLAVDEEDGLWPGLRAVKTPRTGSSNYFFSFRQQTGHYNNVTSSYTTGVNIHWGNSSNYSYFYRMLEPGEVFFDATRDLLVWAVGETTVDDGGGNTTDVFTINLCNSTCSDLWPAFNLTASGTFPDTIRLSWGDNTYNEDGWRIDYSTDGTSWSELTTKAADATSHDHSGLPGATTLFYRIRAYRGASETSDWSNTVSATTPPASGSFGFPIISADDDTLEYTGPYTGQMYPDWTYIWLGYDSGNAATSDEGLRFQNVAIPQGATINSAHINYYAYSSAAGDTSIRFRTENVDDAESFTTASANLTSRSFGSAFVDWTLPTSWSSGSAHQSPDLASILQPIVDREGWGGGNSVVFITQGNPDSPAGSHRVRTYDYGSSWAPVLQVDFSWTPSGPVAPVASFTYSTDSLDATFTDTSSDADGSVVAWSWDFGDGGSSSTQDPMHAYAGDGSFTVSLTYIIERSSGGAGSWAQIGSVGVGIGVFNDNDDIADGSIYDYRVKATGSGFDSVWSNLATVTTFDCSASKTYTGGEWYQFALACDPGPYNTVARIFPSLEPLIYSYDAISGSYTRLASSDTMAPGAGYWVNFFRTLDYMQSGYDTVIADISLEANAVSGRNNLAGLPGNGTVAWPDVLVVDGAQTVTLLEADPWENGPSPINRVCDLPNPPSKCLMSRKLKIWGGTKAAGAYQIYDPDVPGQEGMLVPLDGLWVMAFKSGVKLRIPEALPPGSAPTPEAVAPVALASGESDDSKKKGKSKGRGKGKKNKGETWHVRLIAESGGLRDPGNTLGHKNGSIQGQDARDLEEPPPFAGDHLSILFTNPLFEASAWGFPGTG